MQLTAEQQGAAISLLRHKAGIAETAIRAAGGDANQLYALGAVKHEIDALEASADRRRAQTEPMFADDSGGGGLVNGSDKWLGDVAGVENELDKLPGDARLAAGSVKDALSYVAAESAKDIAKLPGQAAGAVKGVLGFGWSLLPWPVKGFLIAVPVVVLVVIALRVRGAAKE